MERETEKPKVTMPGVVEKIIKSPYEPEKAQITVEGADHLYKEIRIDNTMEDANGNKVKLKEHAEVDVVVEADLQDTIPQNGPAEK